MREDAVWDDNGGGRGARENTDRWITVSERLTRLEEGLKAIAGQLTALAGTLEKFEALELANGKTIEALARRVTWQGRIGLCLVGVVAGLAAGWDPASRAISFLVRLW